jgi:23S rRNA (uridine2552-2'-O)-methyltransferase
MAKRPFERKDRFYFKAKSEGYPARSAYKIMELDDRYKIFKPGRRIVDLGCAPGGWMKVAQERMQNKGKLAGIDLLPIKFTLGPNSFFIEGDFLDISHQNQIKDFLGGKADWIICDMSPNISGVKFRDEFQSYELAMKALEFVLEVLKPGGGFLFKNFPGPEIEDLRKELKKHFSKLKTVVPEATRQSSTEIYIVCQELKPQGKKPSPTQK